MSVVFNKLRYILMNCPYDTWDNPLTKNLFEKTMSLKLNSYKKEYPYGVLPIDTFDFIGTHHLICEEHQGQFKVVMGYKSGTTERSRIHNQTFPALSILRSSNAIEHAHELEKYITKSENKHKNFSYDGSWTIDREIRKDKEYSAHLKKILTALQVFSQQKNNISEIFGFGMIRFKTDIYFKSLGYTAFKSNGKDLPVVSMSSLQGEPGVFCHLVNFSELAIATAQKFQKLWDNRIEISNTHLQEYKNELKKIA